MKKNDIDAGNYIEGNVNDGNVAGRDIINNYYGANNSVSKEELTRAMNSYLEWLIKTCTSLDWFDQIVCVVWIIHQ